MKTNTQPRWHLAKVTGHVGTGTCYVLPPDSNNNQVILLNHVPKGTSTKVLFTVDEFNTCVTKKSILVKDRCSLKEHLSLQDEVKKAQDNTESNLLIHINLDQAQKIVQVSDEIESMQDHQNLVSDRMLDRSKPALFQKA